VSRRIESGIGNSGCLRAETSGTVVRGKARSRSGAGELGVLDHPVQLPRRIPLPGAVALGGRRPVAGRLGRRGGAGAGLRIQAGGRRVRTDVVPRPDPTPKGGITRGSGIYR
jgi:hypothetical protein